VDKNADPTPVSLTGEMDSMSRPENPKSKLEDISHDPDILDVL
jgi:hypothetical protein